MTETITETETARTIVLDVPDWVTSVAGQHVDIRLTAPDGYQATRSYSLSSAPSEPPQITVERFEEGEVSPFLVEVVEVGDTIEVRGPIGGYFVWHPSPDQNPVLLIGGGSGIAPLRAMWRAAGSDTTVTVLYSARERSRVIYAGELAVRDDVTIHLTREAAPEFIDGRIGRDHLEAALDGAAEPDVFVCGPSEFVESVVSDLSTLMGSTDKIRMERFG